MKAAVLAASALAALALAAPALAAPAKTAAKTAAAPTQSKLKITDPVAPAKVPAQASAAWMADNAKQPGVITLPSGLQYKIVKSGDPKGPSPKPGDVIKVNYEGKLTDGKVFDSSFARGHAMIAQLGGLVPGWMEALPLMHPGDEWTLYVPPALGYGPEGQPPVIPPDSVMIFRLQFLGMLSVD